MKITAIQAGPKELAVAKAFNTLWQRFNQEELPVSSTEGNVHFLMTEGPMTIDYQTDCWLKASNEKDLFKVSMIFLQNVLADQLVKGENTFPQSAQDKRLMVDMARKYFSLKDLKELVDMLAFFNFDQLQLHFSENEGFRIESEQYPWLASKEHLTKNEIRELLQYARRRQIEIIPDLDSPGHLQHALEHNPQWRLDKLNDQGEVKKDPKALDILNPEAVAFVHSLYREYGELFQDCRYFHIGADEFVPFDHIENYPTLASYAEKKYGKEASGIEVFIEFVNQTIELVRQLGFIPIVWNDGFYRLNRKEGLHLSKDCQISYWTRWDKNMAPVETFLAEGYSLINHNDNYFYYVLGENASYDYPTYEKVMDNWQPIDFPQQQVVTKEDLQQVKANAISIWADVVEAKTTSEVNQDIFLIVAAMMQKADERTIGSKGVITKMQQQFFNLIK